MIRKMEVDDIATITQIDVDCFSDVYKEEHFVYELQDNPCAFLYVLQEGSEIVGYIDYWITFDCCQLVRIAVRKDMQKKGYAHMLMKHMEMDAIAQECESILLEVRRSNEVAQALYRSHDYFHISVRKGYYSDNNEDAMVMGKAIGGLK